MRISFYEFNSTVNILMSHSSMQLKIFWINQATKSMAIKPLNGTFNNSYETGVYYPNKYEVIVYNYTHIIHYYN